MSAAPSTSDRAIDSEKAQRIIDAMRLSVAKRGVAGSTFDHVAREAGVSRGLLHYYFRTKERLLAEVVRLDGDLRVVALEAQLASASSADDVVAILRASLEDWIREAPELVAVTFELFTLSRRNEDIAVEFAALVARSRELMAGALAAKAAEGVLELEAAPEAVAEVLFGLADGCALRMLGDPDRDWGPVIEAGVVAVRALIHEPR